MGLKERIVRFFQLTNTERQIQDQEIRKENIRRLFYLALIAIPASLLHVLAFYPRLAYSSGNELAWRTAILISHGTIVVVCSLVVLSIWFLVIRPRKFRSWTGHLVMAMFPLIFAIGIAIVAVDQWVTPSITPFLVVCIIISLVLMVRPIFSLIFFPLAALAFVLVLPLTQPDPLVLLSNQANGITAAAIGMCISWVNWHMRMKIYLQQREIEAGKAELQLAYNKLLDYSGELRELNGTKDKLFSIIAHDLRNPFFSILGIIELIREESKSTGNDIRTFLPALEDTTRNAYTLLENLLTWSQSQTGKIRFSPESIPAASLVENSVSLVAGAASAKYIGIKKAVDGGIQVFADRNMVDTILRNLLTNAIKFTPGEGVVTVGVQSADGGVQFSVRDTGVGMAKDLVERMFTVGVHPRPGTANESGTGLGLLLCKEFVDHHGGNLRVTSEPGKGSEFTFWLPGRNGPPA